jgi:molecular chaperone GrpE
MIQDTPPPQTSAEEPSLDDTFSTQIPLEQLEDPRIAELQAQAAAAKDQMLRAIAEAENIRKRAERSIDEARIYAIDRFGKDLLQVADMLARGLASAPPSQDERMATFIEGVGLTQKALLEAFAKNGLRAVGAKGEKFDPNLHQAVSQMPSDVPAGHVAEVLQAGFMLQDRTLRAAMVIVSGGGAAKEPSKEHPKDAPAAPGEGIDIKI